eukprot:CAMPEP_0183369484 /NCGR_PEP_ID=MMETSP0164_2-20130417/99467_1 /TAXON_ID=221442 /ORGANISM="Coccolithus pelagicus ssp braarudi, Strain PLY182g" /LENGTH=324 /DNA_ID=CAMNT_0025545751 /DNA_START=79 /DNA_END=1053 /DNA_ORIENTATION=+
MHPRKGALGSLLRVKGFVWLAPWGSRQGIAALAGTQFTLKPGSPWAASSNRRTELVCIGRGLDHAAALSALTACLLTEPELAAGAASWSQLWDPFFEVWAAEQRSGVTWVLVLHKNETVPMKVAGGVLERAGFGASVVQPLLTAVYTSGQGNVAHGAEADMLVLASLFAAVGMKAVVKQGSAPQVQHYEGPDGQERTRVEYPDGKVQHYEGPKGRERKVFVKFPDGQVQHYAGPKGEERIVRIVGPEKEVECYEGLAPDERKVRTEYPDGRVEHYEGPDNQERKIRVEYADEKKEHLEGPKGEERVVRTEHPDGRVENFETSPC